MEIKVTVTVEATNAIGEPITSVSTTSENHIGDNPRFVQELVAPMITDLADQVAEQVAIGTKPRVFHGA